MKQINHDLATGTITETDLTAEQITEIEQQVADGAWTALRGQRNALLAACDWTVATDSPVDVPAWSTYRQALRDLPANTTDPTAPDWPTPPA